MKRKYFGVEIEIIELYKEDVLTDSSENDVVDDPYNGSQNWWESNK